MQHKLEDGLKKGILFFLIVQVNEQPNIRVILLFEFMILTDMFVIINESEGAHRGFCFGEINKKGRMLYELFHEMRICVAYWWIAMAYKIKQHMAQYVA